jgi:nitrate reductase NapE component
MYRNRTVHALATLFKILGLLSGLLLGWVIAVYGFLVWILKTLPDPPPHPDQLHFF